MKAKSENPLPKTATGAVCAQMVRCGKPTCKCARGELHGPYFYHFVRVNGVLVKRYVKAKDAPKLRAAYEDGRNESRQQREASRKAHRDLRRLLEQLRGSEKLLLQFLEMNHGQTN